MQLNVEDDRIELQPDRDPDAAVIWLHGLGADGYDFEGVIPMLDLPGSAAVRFVFPHAPVQAVTLNGGMQMRSWFDIYGIGPEYPQDEAGVDASAGRVHQLIDEQRNLGIESQRIVLAGFSQGGAVVLHAGLRSPEPLAGILALSTWLPVPQRLEADVVAERRTTPVLMIHGSEDPLVPLEFAEVSSAHLRQVGCSVDFRTLSMAHAISAEELGLIGGWLRERLAL